MKLEFGLLSVVLGLLLCKPPLEGVLGVRKVVKVWVEKETWVVGTDPLISQLEGFSAFIN